MAALDQAVLDFAKSIPESDIPAKLRCASCNKLAVNAIRLPCCDQSLCEDCQAIKQEACPVCMHSPIDLSDCKPNKSLRLTIKAFLKSEEKKRANKAAASANEVTTIDAQSAPPAAGPTDNAEAVAAPEAPQPVQAETHEQVAQNTESQAEQFEALAVTAQADHAMDDQEMAVYDEDDLDEPVQDVAQVEVPAQEEQTIDGDTEQLDVEGGDGHPPDEGGAMDENAGQNQSQQGQMNMPGGGVNAFNGMMGMQNMGMQFPPGMFSGMNMGNMGMNGFGGFGPQGMMNAPFGFFPNGGFNQGYGSQMHQFSNQNFANQYRGRGGYRGRGRGGFRGGFYGNNYYNQQGGMYNGYNQMQGHGMNGGPGSAAGGDMAPDGADEMGLEQGGDQANGHSEHDSGAVHAQNGLDSERRNSTANGDGLMRDASGAQADDAEGTRRAGSGQPEQRPQSAAPPLNAPTGPRAMRMGFQNGRGPHNGMSQPEHQRRGSAATSVLDQTRRMSVNLDAGSQKGSKADERSVRDDRDDDRHSVRRRSRSRTPEDRDRRRRRDDDRDVDMRSGERRDRDDRRRDDSRRRSYKRSRDERSPSPSANNDRSRKHSRRDRSPRGHRDSSRDDRHRRHRSSSRDRYRSERSDRDRDREKDRRRRHERDDRSSRRDRDSDRPRRDRGDKENDRDRERRKDRDDRDRSRSPSQDDFIKRLQAPRGPRRRDEPAAEEAKDASDDVGFRIKGSRKAADRRASDATATREAAPSAREKAPPAQSATADPYALEREKRQQERMAHEQKRRERETASKGKQGRDDDSGRLSKGGRW